MTFEEFQQTREFHPDLGKVDPQMPWCEGQRHDFRQPALSYDGRSYGIKLVTEDWPARASREGAYHLLIGNMEWIDDDLEELERRLYDDMIVSEGRGEPFDWHHAVRDAVSAAVDAELPMFEAVPGQVSVGDLRDTPDGLNKYFVVTVDGERVAEVLVLQL